MAASSEGVLPHRKILGGGPSIAARAPHVIQGLQLEHQRAQQQVSQLQDHIMQLADLSSLLGELPDKTQHNIMVPFGPMAFFPGRLIHTNEVLVRLGQDTVVERSAKQTQQLLARRSKVLEAQSKGAQRQQAALERRLTMVHAILPEATAGQRPGVGSEAEFEIREELEEQGSVDLRVPAVIEKRPDGVPGPGRASSGAAHLHMTPQQPDGRQPGLGSTHEPAASRSESTAEGLDDGPTRLDAIIAAEAGSTTAPSKSPSKTPAAALRRGFLGPAHRPDTRKVPAKQAVKQLPPAAEEEQPLAQVREWEAAAKPQKPEAPSAANSKRMSKFKQLRMVSE